MDDALARMERTLDQMEDKTRRMPSTGTYIAAIAAMFGAILVGALIALAVL